MDRKEDVSELISNAVREGAEDLNLSGMGLTELPSEMRKLTNLRSLEIYDNQLKSLPSWLFEFRELRDLYIGPNELTSLPPEIGQLENLETLALDGNPGLSIPIEITKLKNLTTLFFFSADLKEFPLWICSLEDLEYLYLKNNELRTLPPEIGRLTNLETLDLEGNELVKLPVEIGYLTNLFDLVLDDNTELSDPPPEIVQQGTQAILTYFRDRLKLSSRQWVSKLLVVGEGGVGKTSLLRALRNEPFNHQESTTHGIEIRPLELEHPKEPGVIMKLNAWDFGGQDIYHATHQFFLTNRSLFLLVWNARLGFEQGKIYRWLDTIQALAPDSPVLLVATWIDERDADIPLAELRRKYPQIIGQCAISNRTGTGVDEVRSQIADAAAGLPLMGEEWPTSWLTAANSIRAKSEKYMSPAKIRELMSEQNVLNGSATVLAQWLHELGDILYFRDNDELNDTVILKPQWVTEYISKVLESDEVIEKSGVFTREHMNKLWQEIDPVICEHFLRLMERFDLSYRTLENREVSLVVERLPRDEPPYQDAWNLPKTLPDCEEISMKFLLNTIPAGIPTWFIARSHRFTTHTHWRTGALFAYEPERKHLGLIQAFPHDRFIRLTVRGPNPQNFFALLKDGIELTLARFPGLQITRLIPCPGHDGDPCAHEFDYELLLKRAKRKPMIECPESLLDISVAGLLFGLHWTTNDAVLSRLDELEAAEVERHDKVLDAIENLRVLAQREFTNAFHREQSRIESYCPNIFVLRPSESKGWLSKIWSQKMKLQLLCQAPGNWHPTESGGLYDIDQPAEWLRTIGPYIKAMFSVLKYAAPVVGPWIGVLSPDHYKKLFEDDIKLMEELVKKLPEISITERSGFDDPRLSASFEGPNTERVEGAALRALRLFLDDRDSEHQWGGLKRILTPEGHYLWLCQHHSLEYAK